MRIAVASILFSLSVVAAANAACIDIIKPPLAYTRSNFAELESLKPASSLNSVITEVPHLAVDGHGKINIDQYSITLDANGESAAEFLKEFKSNIGEIVYSGDEYGNLKAYDQYSKTKWQSDAPKGAVMLFTLKEIRDPTGLTDIAMPAETAGVVVSCYDSSSFIFTPVTIGSSLDPTKPGLHPVTGNRGFGVFDNGDGSLTLFVKATDRVINEGIFKLFITDASREFIFDQGHGVWLHMLDNIKSRYASRNPRDVSVFSERVDF